MAIIGFAPQLGYFKRLLKEDALSHAYLFSGPEMIGKKKCAQEIYTLANPHGEADLLRVAPRISEGEAKIYVDDIRGVVTFLSRRPLHGPYKFVVIDDAHELTAEASNALLKVLEEPTPHSVLILISSQSKLLLPTIASRCQEISFLPHSSESIQEVMRGKNVSHEDAELLGHIVAGRLGWAIRLAESDSIGGMQASVKDFQKLVTQGIAERLSYAKKMHEKDAYSPTIEFWLHWAHAQLKKGSISPSVVRGLMQLRYIISQPQYNHRSALENFLVQL